ncbi:MAG: tol-pal system protein YbgF [Candidatus Binatia bacterium]
MPAGARAGLSALFVVALAGCASQGEVMRADRQVRQMILEDRKKIEQMQRTLERLQRAVDEGRGGARGGDRVAALEKRLDELEGRPGASSVAPSGAEPAEPPPATAERPAPQPAARPEPPQPAAAAPAPPAVPPAGDDEWRRDVEHEQAAVGATNVKEKAEYLGIVEVLGRKDCAKAVPQLNSFASAYKDSPLADNATYWVARCYQQRGDNKQAISKFYDVVTKYPRGDKTPAALWAQGNLFVAVGDTPDARLALGKLIREYPNSDEAARARQKITELER